MQAAIKDVSHRAARITPPKLEKNDKKKSSLFLFFLQNYNTFTLIYPKKIFGRDNFKLPQKNLHLRETKYFNYWKKIVQKNSTVLREEEKKQHNSLISFYFPPFNSPK